MQVQKTLVFIFLGWLLLTGCGGGNNVPRPTPDLDVDRTPFIEAGCSGGWETCADQPAFSAFGCDRIQPAEPLLGGLGRPLAECWVIQRFDETSPALQEITQNQSYFHTRGCMLRIYVRYIVFVQGEFRLLKTPSDWLALGGPLDTPEKALSFALAATGLYADFTWKPDPGLIYYDQSAAEQTSVVAAGQGWRINLFRYQACGCGPHDTSRVDVFLTPDGALSLSEPRPLFRDPAEDGLCVD